MQINIYINIHLILPLKQLIKTMTKHYYQSTYLITEAFGNEGTGKKFKIGNTGVSPTSSPCQAFI